MHRDRATLDGGLAEIRSSPPEEGRVELIVARPAENERDLLDEGLLDPEAGLVGDSWRARGSGSMPDRSPHPDAQLTLMNARAAALVAGDRERWALAGDKLYVDRDLAYANLPPGPRLKVGEAVIEITTKPHRGCGK